MRAQIIKDAQITYQRVQGSLGWSKKQIGVLNVLKKYAVVFVVFFLNPPKQDSIFKEAENAN